LVQSTKDLKKAEIERFVFERFAWANGWKFSSDMLESMKSPAPDLLFRSEFGTFGIEVAQLIENESAQNYVQPKNAKIIYPALNVGEIVRRKLQNEYVISHPLELLLFCDGALYPDNIILDEIMIEIDAAEKNPFRRIWFWRVGKSSQLLFPINQ
jgi:hypothetical protein